MLCPKCKVEMEKRLVMGIEVDGCASCGGVLLDKGELEAIESAGAASTMDLSGMRQGASHVDAEPAFCHRCNEAMLPLSGANDVRFDWCMTCESMFFDQGEIARLTAPTED